MPFEQLTEELEAAACEKGTEPVRRTFVYLASHTSTQPVCRTDRTQPAQGPRAKGVAPPPGPGVSATVSGTIKQFNYDRDAEVKGFLLSNNALVHLPPPMAAHIASAVHVGDSVQITGLAQTSPAGVQSIEAQNLEDKTSGKTFALPQPGAPAPSSGSGRIQQLNYGPDGAIEGFLFDNGTLATMLRLPRPIHLRFG